MELVRAAGWNQTEADWKRFLESDPDGCFVAEAEEKVCGTTATIIYDGKLAWIGMVLVSPRSRGCGIGTELMRTALEYLDSRGPLTIKLDATPQGQTIYERFGFKPECEIERCLLNTAPRAGAARDGDRPRSEAAILESIAVLDAEILGARRSALLRSVDGDAPELTVVISDAGTVTGYALGRHGLIADQLGPWAAQDQNIARQLLENFLSRTSRERVIVDCLKSHRFARDVLNAAGFQFSRTLTRMVRGTEPPLGKMDTLCAILGPEFG